MSIVDFVQSEFNTPAERAQMAAVLRRAKIFLNRQWSSQYVCWAISDAVSARPDMRVYGAQLRRAITVSLGGCATVTQWLEEQHGVRRTKMTVERTYAYRQAWIDQMIKELEAC